MLTNLNGTGLPTVATLHLVDRFLGEGPGHWSERYLELTEQIEAAADQAKAVADVDRQPGTSPSHPLAEYAGTYSHPAYGEMEVAHARRRAKPPAALHVAYHTLESALEHWHYDVFRATDEELEGTKLSFANGLSGHVESLAVDLQPGVDSIEFDKLPPKELADPALLAEYAGDYEVMGLTVTLAVRAARTMAAPSSPSPSPARASPSSSRCARTSSTSPTRKATPSTSSAPKTAPSTRSSSSSPRATCRRSGRRGRRRAARTTR